MANTFRLYGPEVGKATAIIDADVTGANTDGSIELTPTNGDYDAFRLDSDRLRELIDAGLAYDYDTIDTKAERWKAISDLEDHYNSAAGENPEYLTAARTLFESA